MNPIGSRGKAPTVALPLGSLGEKDGEEAPISRRVGYPPGPEAPARRSPYASRARPPARRGPAGWELALSIALGPPLSLAGRDTEALPRPRLSSAGRRRGPSGA